MLAKYFPEIGRAYNYWTGQQYMRGATMGKNQLGHACMIIGIVFVWNLVQVLQMKGRKGKLYEILISACLLVMTGWLLKNSDSATSLATGVLGVFVLLVVGLPFVSKKHMGTNLIVAIIPFPPPDSMFR